MSTSGAAHPFSIQVSEADFDPATEYGRLLDLAGDAGAVVTFVGLVRGKAEGQQVSELYLQHYAGLTEKLMQQILDEACSRWRLLAARVIHRVGSLQPGDQIVYVGVASAHRGDAFAACEFIMDYLKTRAAFWKKETDASGSHWLESRQTDQHRAERWKIDGEKLGD